MLVISYIMKVNRGNCRIFSKIISGGIPKEKGMDVKFMKRVAVIGGGITGLSTMFYLQKLKQENNLDIELALIDSSEQLGGKIRTVKCADYKMETGADSMVVTKENVMPLIEALGLQNEVVYNATGISYLFVNDELLPIPEDTVFGIPTNEQALFASQLISESGKLRALEDYNSRNTTFTSESSIGDFLEFFLGEEIVEKQIAPVLSGVYSGNLHDLSIASTLPYLLDYKNEYGSILKGLEINQSKFKSNSNKKFISFKGGLGTLIEALENALTDVRIFKGIATTNITKHGEEYVVELSSGGSLVADTVVVSTSHQIAQQLLNDERLNPLFNQFLNSSLTSVYLGFDIPDSELPADGTGFIVSSNGNLLCNASTWSSRKWPHTSVNGNLLVRLFYKSSIPSYSELDTLSEEEFVEIALKDIEKSLGFMKKPAVVEVTKWNDLMPNYTLQHPEAVASLRKEMACLYPEVILAGCSYDGVGIGACITNGKETAEAIAEKWVVIK